MGVFMKRRFFSIFLPLIFLGTHLFGEVYTNADESKLSDDPRDLYVDLIKRCVANTIYEDAGIYNTFNPDLRENGRDWPSVAHTMIGTKRLDNIHYCLKEILENQIPGDCIETGVWRGGATILMRAILKAYGDNERLVYVADSFEGFQPSKGDKYPADATVDLTYFNAQLAVSLDQVKRNFMKYGLLDKQVVFIKGYFCDTLPDAPIEKLSLLRLDGDLYESTIDALENLYPKLSIGGYIIIDDFGALTQCARAVLDYRKKYNICEPMESIDWSAVFWKKTR